MHSKTNYDMEFSQQLFGTRCFLKVTELLRAEAEI